MAALPELIAEAILTTAKAGRKAKGVAKAAADPFADLVRIVGGEPAPPAPGTVGLESQLPLAHGRVSQRVPMRGKVPTGDEARNLLINMDVMQHNPKHLQTMADIVSGYPMTTDAMKEMPPLQRLQAFRDFTKDNYLALWDMMPAAERERAGQWYHGGHRITGERATQYGIPHVASAGSYAALSPQMEWFKNVHHGDVTLHALDSNPAFSSDMMRAATQNKNLIPAFSSDPQMMELLRSMQGRKLLNMTPSEQAVFIRLWDETHGKPQYHSITPEGDYGPIVLKKDGTPAKPGWGNFRDIERAVRNAQSGGDMSIISANLGGAHKVRGFHNDLIAPVESAPFGDVVIDTHQIGAGNFSPMSSSSPEVEQGFSKPMSNPTGVRGLYPVYADATRLAARERGVPGYKMQSVPWEAIRSLMPEGFKTAGNMEKVKGIWREYGAGRIKAPEARARIIKLAGGFNPPKWVLVALAGMGLGPEVMREGKANA